MAVQLHRRGSVLWWVPQFLKKRMRQEHLRSSAFSRVHFSKKTIISPDRGQQRDSESIPIRKIVCRIDGHFRAVKRGETEDLSLVYVWERASCGRDLRIRPDLRLRCEDKLQLDRGHREQLSSCWHAWTKIYCAWEDIKQLIGGYRWLRCYSELTSGYLTACVCGNCAKLHSSATCWYQRWSHDEVLTILVLYLGGKNHRLRHPPKQRLHSHHYKQR